jgi:hypothetical protein
VTTPLIKIKVFPKTSIKGKMDVRFPAKVETENFLTVTRANGIYTFGIDYTLLTDAPIINPSTAMVVVLDKSAGIYKLQSVAELGTDLPANSVTYGQIQQVGANKLLGNPTGSTANVSEIPIGTGIAAALGVNVGSAGAPVVNGGVLGTPSSGTATNLTGLPISTGVSGLATGVAAFLATPSSANLRAVITDEVGTGAAYFVGGALGTPASGTATNLTGLPLSSGISGAGTGVLTALGVNVGTAGSIVVNGGALGTPSSGTLTNATGLPISTGVSGLGTGVATALAVNVGTAGSPVVNGGALGTPLSGVATNLTGTASGLTAGHVTTNANLTGDVTSVGNATTLAAGNAGNLNSGTLLAARMPALTGDVTTTAGTVATTIGANAVGNSKLATMAAFTFKGNNTSGTAAPTDVDISLLTAKASPAATDLVIISDQAASGAWKKVSVSALASAGSVSSIAGNTGAFTLSNGVTNSTNDIRLDIGNLPGLSGNTAAAAGKIGEVIQTSGISGSLTSGVAAQLATLSLTAGDWDVSWTIQFNTGGSTTTTDYYASASTSSASLTAMTNSVALHERISSMTDHGFPMSHAPFQSLLSATTSIYLNAQWVGGGTAVSVTYTFRARRMR